MSELALSPAVSPGSGKPLHILIAAAIIAVMTLGAASIVAVAWHADRDRDPERDTARADTLRLAA